MLGQRWEAGDLQKVAPPLLLRAAAVRENVSLPQVRNLLLVVAHDLRERRVVEVRVALDLAEDAPHVGGDDALAFLDARRVGHNVHGLIELKQTGKTAAGECLDKRWRCLGQISR